MAVSCNSRQPKSSAYPSEPQDKNTAVSSTNTKPAAAAAASDNDVCKQIEAASESAYIFGQVAPGSGNASSPAWSTSSTSNDDYNGAGPAPLGLLPQNNKVADKADLVAGLLFNPDTCSLEQGAQQWLAAAYSQEMFPALLATTANTPPHHSPASSDAGLAVDARSITVSAATHPESIANTSADAALDGWLQQFVNADAIGGATTAVAAAPSSSPLSSHITSTVYSPGLPFYSGADAVAALLSSSASPGLSGIASQPGAFSFESAATAAASVPVPVLSDIMPLQASPVMHGSPLQSPLSTGTDVLDQTTVNAFAAAAAAAAVAASTSSLPSSIESISPELLASVISSGVCAYGSALVEPQELLPPAASEISMLAALPFTSIAMPAANIAPQKTLSVSHTEEPTVPDVAASYVSHPVVSSQPLPPSKRQRRSVPSLRKASSRQGVLEPSIAGVENASGCSSSSSNQSSSTGTAASSASRKCATKSAASEKGSQPKTAVPHTLPSRPIAPSSSSGNGSHSMVPLAPRQPATQSPSSVPDIRKKQKLQPKDSAVQNEDKKVANTCLSSGLSSSSSGSSTPPGLSVLAKIAQKQVPIRVKEEEEVMNAANQQNTYQGRLIAPSPARRQTRSPSLPPVKAEAALSPATNSADSTVQKRQERLIKNRAAALLSRKRKRDYMTKLESEVEDLRTSNTTLIKRMEDMERAMKALAEERDRLRDENEAARVLASATTPSTGTTASASAANNNSSNVTTEKSEEKAKEQGESSEANDGKGGDAVEASDGTMDIDGPLSGGEVFGQQQRGGANSKQRTAGALLMAMLFSFSLFTLPSMYTSSNQITAGGPQSAGIIPIRSLPSPEPRLLIGSGKTSDNAAEPPLIERVRRSITALTQQAGPNQANDEPQYANGSDSSGNWMRPMTMEESAELHAWIRHGLTPKDKSTSAIAPRGDSARRVPKVVVEHVKESTARAGSVPNSLSVVHQQMHEANDYAMLYCPTMQHVVFGGDSLETADMNGYLSANNNGGGNNAPLVYSPSAPRVIDTAKQQQQQQQQQKQQASEGDSDTVAVVHGGRMMDDVDSEVIASPRVADWHTEASSHADLVPTHVGKSMFAAASSNRPKLSLYSPIVGGGGGGSSNSISSSNGGGEILPPWDEYARLAASAGESEEQQAAELAADNRQKYLRIDVEVVGSRWVTADKFAHGLY